MFNVKWSRLETESLFEGQIVSWMGHKFKVLSIGDRQNVTIFNLPLIRANLIVKPLTEIDDEWLLSVLQKGNVHVS